MWLNVSLLEKVSQLERDLLQRLFCKFKSIALKLSERYKLNNISIHILFVFVWVEWCDISIKLVHGWEICIANTNYHNTKRIIWASYNLVNRFLEIIYHAISKNQ